MKLPKSTSSLSASEAIDEPSQALFDLMRDGVVVGVYSINSNTTAKWRVTLRFHVGGLTDWVIKEVDSPISALDAFLKARVAVFTRLIQGEPVYSPQALKKRQELNLD